MRTTNNAPTIRIKFSSFGNMETAIITQENAKRVIGKPFQPGNPGRPVGVQNKLSKTVRETVLEVFNKLQDDPEHSLEKFAKEDHTEFYKIAAKLIPTEITGTLKQIILVTDQDDPPLSDALVIIPNDGD